MVRLSYIEIGIYVLSIAKDAERHFGEPKQLMATVPSWAMQLVKEVATYKGRSKLPKIKWIQRGREYSTGRYRRWSKEIVMGAGRNEQEAKQVLLHELAHWLTSSKARKGHCKKFWLTLKDLLIQFDSYTDEYRQREFGYKKKAQAYL